MSDGTIYTYINGNEYEDIPGAWDWNLILGITTDYATTPLSCSTTNWRGIEQFVGGASDSHVGVAAMRYTNPFTGALSWQKTWFFLQNDVQFVMVSNLTSNSTPLYSVLDQRRRVGDIVVDDVLVGQPSNYTGVNSLWHGDVGYTFGSNPGMAGLSVEMGEKISNWFAIDISVQPNTKVDLFVAYISHSSTHTPISYTVFPAVSRHDFKNKRKSTKLRTIQNDGHISALFDDLHNSAMVVFWDSTGGSVVIPGSSILDAPLTITSSGNSAVIYQLESDKVTISDPSQNLTTLDIKMQVGLGEKPPHWGEEFSHDLLFSLPTGGSAGSSVSQSIYG